MPTDDLFRLTTKDCTILEIMLEGCPDKGGPMALLLRGKLDNATVLFWEDMPPDVVRCRAASPTGRRRCGQNPHRHP